MPVVIDLKRRGNAALVSRAAALRAQGAAPRYEHCARALQQWQAEALVAFGRGTQLDPTGLLAARVERQRGEYWGKWGSAARVTTRTADGAEHARVA